MTERTDQPVFYLDTEDTLATCNITRRQLSYWREKNLITPELGLEAKRFTERDIRQLKYLRRLIVDLGFPPELIKKLMPVTKSGKPRDISAFPYLDLGDLTLKTKQELSERLWHEFGATAGEKEIEERLYQLALLLFGLVQANYRSPQAFMARRDEILETLKELSAVQRFVATYDNENPQRPSGTALKPRLPDDAALEDPDLSHEAGRLIRKHGERQDGFRKVWAESQRSDNPADDARYVDSDLMEAVFDL